MTTYKEINKKINKGKKLMNELEQNIKINPNPTYTELLKENEYLKGMVKSQTKFINDLQKILKEMAKSQGKSC